MNRNSFAGSSFRRLALLPEARLTGNADVQISCEQRLRNALDQSNAYDTSRGDLIRDVSRDRE